MRRKRRQGRRQLRRAPLRKQPRRPSRRARTLTLHTLTLPRRSRATWRGRRPGRRTPPLLPLSRRPSSSPPQRRRRSQTRMLTTRVCAPRHQRMWQTLPQALQQASLPHRQQRRRLRRRRRQTCTARRCCRCEKLHFAFKVRLRVECKIIYHNHIGASLFARQNEAETSGSKFVWEACMLLIPFNSFEPLMEASLCSSPTL